MSGVDGERDQPERRERGQAETAPHPPTAAGVEGPCERSERCLGSARSSLPERRAKKHYYNRLNCLTSALVLEKRIEK